MEIGIEIKEKFSLLHVVGDVSEGDLEELSKAFDNLLKKGYLHIVLDLTGVSLMSAKGLGVPGATLESYSLQEGGFKDRGAQ